MYRDVLNKLLLIILTNYNVSENVKWLIFWCPEMAIFQKLGQIRVNGRGVAVWVGTRKMDSTAHEDLTEIVLNGFLTLLFKNALKVVSIEKIRLLTTMGICVYFTSSYNMKYCKYKLDC